MRPEPGQVLHFSEDPTITRFVPHIAATANEPDPYVWAVDADRRVLPQLWPFWASVITTTLGHSGIRLRNARPGPTR